MGSWILLTTLDLTYHTRDVSKQCTTQRRGCIIVASHQDLQHFQLQKSLAAIDVVSNISTRHIQNET